MLKKVGKNMALEIWGDEDVRSIVVWDGRMRRPFTCPTCQPKLTDIEATWSDG